MLSSAGLLGAVYSSLLSVLLSLWVPLNRRRGWWQFKTLGGWSTEDAGTPRECPKASWRWKASSPLMQGITFAPLRTFEEKPQWPPPWSSPDMESDIQWTDGKPVSAHNQLWGFFWSVPNPCLVSQTLIDWVTSFQFDINRVLTLLTESMWFLIAYLCICISSFYTKKSLICKQLYIIISIKQAGFC